MLPEFISCLKNLHHIGFKSVFVFKIKFSAKFYRIFPEYGYYAIVIILQLTSSFPL